MLADRCCCEITAARFDGIEGTSHSPDFPDLSGRAIQEPFPIVGFRHHQGIGHRERSTASRIGIQQMHVKGIVLVLKDAAESP